MAASSFGLMSCSSSAGPRNWLWSGINRTELQSKDFVTWLLVPWLKTAYLPGRIGSAAQEHSLALVLAWLCPLVKVVISCFFFLPWLLVTRSEIMAAPEGVPSP